jgi:hypothetical protein
MGGASRAAHYFGGMKMTHKETRHKKAASWKAQDYLKWYARSGASPFHVNVAADYLGAMTPHEKKILSRLVEDIAHDISRDRKRDLVEDQLFTGEKVINW